MRHRSAIPDELTSDFAAFIGLDRSDEELDLCLCVRQ